VQGQPGAKLLRQIARPKGADGEEGKQRGRVLAMASVRSHLRARYPVEFDYLAQPFELDGFFGLLLLLLVYTFFNAGGREADIALGGVVIAAMAALRVPRGVVYAAILLGVLWWVSDYVFIYAHGGQDKGADRDDAVEIGARALGAGKNPWHKHSILGLPITTGPTSLLLALPFVALSNSIDALTFAFWALFLVLLALGDVRTQNRTFPFLAGFLLLPFSGFSHTLFWALDELYYGAILVAALWLLMESQRLFLAGALAGLIALGRLSYSFGLLAFGIWWLLARRPRPREILRLFFGGVAVAVALLVTFRLAAGKGIWRENFLHNLPQEPLVTGSNALATALAGLLARLGGSVWVATLMVIALIIPISIALRHERQPFLLFGIGMLLAHTIAFAPGQPLDYMLAVLIPGMYAVAYGTTTSVRTA
jgi:hypothetical protein